jgi:sulfate adenylyltransferase large subunit
MDLLRLATAGSVDDGKSTLIGRLLYDSKALMADEVESMGEDLALAVDGLRAEREQGITIDVAYRHFATPRRRFILADTPGHVQYTRNMVTGASTAEVALVLVDARHGVIEQTRRHAAIAALLGVRHVAVCVNKMGLVGHSEERFDAIVRDFCELASRVGLEDVTYLPVSALHGDNVVQRSTSMPWYSGPSLLEHLESVPAGADDAAAPARFPVQYVIWHGESDYRGYAGAIASGTLRVGDEVCVLPRGERSRIAAIDGPDGPLTEAATPLSVTVRLEDDVDVARGDLIAPAPQGSDPFNRGEIESLTRQKGFHPSKVGETESSVRREGSDPWLVREFAATVCWLADGRGAPGSRYLLKHTTRTVRARLEAIDHRLDVATLEPEPADALALNDIGRVRIHTAEPLAADPYAVVRATGAFVLVDETTNDTVAAGMIGY